LLFSAKEASVARTLATRDMAARAGVNVPLLQYYFENKKGVYQTCAEHIANDAWMNFEPVVTHATEGLCHIRGGRVSSEQTWKLL
jgi:AcrR family transcriptional regulator